MNQEQYTAAHSILCASFAVERKALRASAPSDHDPRWHESDMRFRRAVDALARCRTTEGVR